MNKLSICFLVHLVQSLVQPPVLALLYLLGGNRVSAIKFLSSSESLTLFRLVFVLKNVYYRALKDSLLLQNVCLIPKIGFDTVENEPSKIWANFCPKINLPNCQKPAQILIACGLAVDYSAHIAHYFNTAKGPQRACKSRPKRRNTSIPAKTTVDVAEQTYFFSEGRLRKPLT